MKKLVAVFLALMMALTLALPMMAQADDLEEITILYPGEETDEMSAFLNGAALVFAAILVGFVIAQYVHSQLAAQRKKEMKMAADIQESAIPRIFPPFPDEKRIDIFADMLSSISNR